MNITEKWLDGVKLGEAWFHFARPERKEEYRNASGSLQRSAYCQRLMQDELIDRIRDSEILCAAVNPY